MLRRKNREIKRKKEFPDIIRKKVIRRSVGALLLVGLSFVGVLIVGSIIYFAGGKFEPQEPTTTILGAILVVVGLIYKPLYESLTDRKIELIDYLIM
ncbi:MAG: hypothetical protein ACTSX9_08360 [Candidatus Njordarchaeales archaeon]